MILGNSVSDFSLNNIFPPKSKTTGQYRMQNDNSFILVPTLILFVSQWFEQFNIEDNEVGSG